MQNVRLALHQKIVGICLTAVFGLSLHQVSFANPMQSKNIEKPTKPTPKNPNKVTGLLYSIGLPAGASSAGQSKKGKTIAYLYGSIHVAKADFYPLSTPVRKAYAQADTILVEADITNEAANKATAGKLTYVAPDKLENHLSPATWGALKAMTGEMTDQFQQYHPVMVAMGLTVSVGQQLGYDPALGIDLHFIKAAKKDKKNLMELDSVQFQADVLANLSDAESDALLANTLDSFRKGEVKQEFARLSETWRAADAEGLTKILLEEGNKDIGSQKIMQKLMDERNPMMAQKISDFMRAGK
uniref:TraB/GumN family protein n=1 Tax=Undibacterium sp. TaxID=1914977 RepID=UPI00375265CE